MSTLRPRSRICCVRFVAPGALLVAGSGITRGSLLERLRLCNGFGGGINPALRGKDNKIGGGCEGKRRRLESTRRRQAAGEERNLPEGNLREGQKDSKIAKTEMRFFCRLVIVDP